VTTTTSSSSIKTEVDLTGDLSGLLDGSVVYLSSSSPIQKQDGARQSERDDGTTAPGDDDDDYREEELLEQVKNAYVTKNARRRDARRRRWHEKKNPRTVTTTTTAASSSDPTHGRRQRLALPPLPPSRASLPAASYREEIITTLDDDDNRVVVVCGATGCGKSTQVPQYLLEGALSRNDDDDDGGTIVVTQPRRVAAMSLAERVAEERGCGAPGRPGSVVGYSVRLESRVSEEARIVYVTVGVLLRLLVSSSFGGGGGEDDVPLGGVSHVIIDEVHERDLNTDFVLTLLRMILKVNTRIKIILMSATASSELFVKYFERTTKQKPKVITIPGRTFPVTTYWLSDCEQMVSSRLMGWNRELTEQQMRRNDDNNNDVMLSPPVITKIDDSFLAKLIATIIVNNQKKTQQRQQQQALPNNSHNNNNKHAATRKDGAILVFLPGKPEINSLLSTISHHPLLSDPNHCTILPLHSELAPADQKRVFARVPANLTKIILSTNVAETSLTIPDVSIVIDTGRAKESRYDPTRRAKELVTVWTSRASATQRSGRAGRTCPGVCYRLYAEEFFGVNAGGVMLDRTAAEIFRTPLDELVLQVCLFWEMATSSSSMVTNGDDEGRRRRRRGRGMSPIAFLNGAPEPPHPSKVWHACCHLREVGALRLVIPPPSEGNIASTDHDQALFRLTPLGYHLAQLPVDAKVGKILLVGCILGCTEPALTIAAALSHSKSIWLNYLPSSSSRGNDGTTNTSKAQSREMAAKRHRDLILSIVNGSGGGTTATVVHRADTIATVVAYDAWTSRSTRKDRKLFAATHALDHGVLWEMNRLREQFRDCLVAADFLPPRVHRRDGGANGDESLSPLSIVDDETTLLLATACLVAGLYPNVATLVRPNKEKRIRGRRLLTKDVAGGETCLPDFSSFQRDRVKNASEVGKDVYAVYHGTHRSVNPAGFETPRQGGRSMGTHRGGSTPPSSSCLLLSEVNFVSRLALLLFGGGEMDVRDDGALVVDDWLKFKVGSERSGYDAGGLLIRELRVELERVLLRRIVGKCDDDDDNNGLSSDKGGAVSLQQQKRVMHIVKTLLLEG